MSIVFFPSLSRHQLMSRFNLIVASRLRQFSTLARSAATSRYYSTLTSAVQLTSHISVYRPSRNCGAVINSKVCLPSLLHESNANNLRHMSKRPWVVKNSRFIEDLLEEAVERINDLPPNTVAAVWSTVPVLLSRRHRKRDQLTREQALMQCESQIESIVKHTMNSLKGMRPKEIATITVGVAKVVQNIQQTKKERWSVDQQAFGNILMNDKSSQECILHPLAEAANNVLQDCDPCQLSDLAFAHALLRNDQKVHGVNTTLFGNIADASLDCINKFNLDELSNLVWAYATLNAQFS